MLHRVSGIILFLVGILTLTTSAADGMTGNPETCPLPALISVTGVTGDQAVVLWSQSDSVTQIDIRWRVVGDTEWTERTGVTSPDTLTGLEMCVRYEMEFRSTCSAVQSAFGQRQVFNTDGCCRLPSGVTFQSISSSSATLIWDSVEVSTGFLVRYKRPADTTWNEIPVNGTGAVLGNLAACAVYDVQLRTRCGASDSSQLSKTFLLQTTGCETCTDQIYCVSRAFDATNLWIDSISLGALRMQSGSNGGYFAYIGDPTTLERDRSYNLSVHPGFRSDACPVYLRAWLDLDQNGEFNDSLELVLDGIDSTASGLSATITLADSLPLGTTRMRVATAYVTDTIGPLACDIFNFGEVEDYCVVIGDLCPIAENLDTMSVEEKAATLFWEASSKSLGYIYRYREVGDSDWEDEQITMDTAVQISGLTKCTDYEFQLVSVCIQDTTHQSIFFTTQCPSSTQDIPKLLSSFNIYPNPVQSTFTVEMVARSSTRGHIQLIDLMGHQLHLAEIDLVAEQRISYRIDELGQAPPGIYVVVFRTADGVVSRKVMKASD